MIKSSTILKAYVRKRGSDDEWQDITAPKWFRDGKEAFMKKFIDENDGFVTNEEDWGLFEKSAETV